MEKLFYHITQDFHYSWENFSFLYSVCFHRHNYVEETFMEMSLTALMVLSSQ